MRARPGTISGQAETLLYCALIGYIHYEAPVEEQNFSTLIEMINSMEVREDDEEFKNAVDLMFDELKERNPTTSRCGNMPNINWPRAKPLRAYW